MTSDLSNSYIYTVRGLEPKLYSITILRIVLDGEILWELIMCIMKLSHYEIPIITSSLDVSFVVGFVNWICHMYSCPMCHFFHRY